MPGRTASDGRRPKIFTEADNRVLEEAALPAEAIDRVFLTGGTAFVPAVRRLFEQRFGVEKLAGGGEFVSVAEGLALLGAAVAMQ